MIGDPANDPFLTSALVTGRIYAADLADPTPAILTEAISDMKTAYDDAAGRTDPDHTELYAGDLTGQTLTPGLYKWETGVDIDGAGVTLIGDKNDVFIFQIAGDLTIASDAIVTLDGVQDRNIFWQVAGVTTLGTGSVTEGIILSGPGVGVDDAIRLLTGAELNGRAFSQKAVTLQSNIVETPTD